MSPELVGIIFTGLGGLIAAFSTFNSNRSKQATADAKQATADVKALRLRVRRLEKRDLASAQHMLVLEREIIKLGGDLPVRPPIIDVPLVEEDPDE